MFNSPANLPQSIMIAFFFCDGFDLSADFKPIVYPLVNYIFPVFEEKPQSHIKRTAQNS
jgi:hypothetical protein